MHRALMNGVIILEIIQQIIRHDELDMEMQELGLLVPSVLGSSSAHTLYALALTCHILSRHALDALWMALDDLTPLLKILPSFRGNRFDGPLSGPQLARFEEYANRVRFYKCHGKDRIGTSAYVQLMQARHTRTLLPSLLYLSTTASYPALQYLSGSSLLALCCSPPITETSPIDIWNLIHTCTTSKKPTLRYLKLNLFLSDYHIRSIIQLSNLKYLALYNPAERPMTLDFEFLQTISKFECLTKLVLSGSLSLSTENLPASNLPAFPVLNNLWISLHPTQLSRIIRFLDMGKFERLDTLWLNFPPLPDDGWKDIVTMPWIHFFKILRLKTSPRFKSLVVDSCSPFNAEKPIAEWPMFSLADVPDFCLLKLTRLRIAFPIFTTISNADIYKMVSSFPSLISLDLVTRLPWQTDFMSMIAIAKGLPNLRELSLGLNAHSLPPESQIPLLSHRLCSLKLVVSRLQDPRQFAFYLDRIFHKLQTFDIYGSGSGSEDPVQKRALEEVKQCLAQFSRAQALQTRQLISTDPRLRLSRSQAKLTLS
ncbi:hypothetical protein BJ912DRAFT_250971 [Pholiota molesta]|nr:hypothetical protein BJ912DRAFT_250971 [Pholiota molesta]